MWREICRVTFVTESAQVIVQADRPSPGVTIRHDRAVDGLSGASERAAAYDSRAPARTRRQVDTRP